jgi:WhiB family redox-sensing transcriptional regulator
MDTELFFPEKGDSATVEEARTVCNKCAVKQTCLNWAMTNEIWHGVWGGLSGNQRYIKAKNGRRVNPTQDNV